MMFAGIDVGTKRSPMAIIEKNSVRVFQDYSDFRNLSDIHAVGIDAPLSFPERGYFRECEKELLRRGIRLFPSGAQFFRKTAEKGMKIADELRHMGVRVFEVYPFATRVILEIAPECNKRRKDCLERIKRDLEKYIPCEVRNHDEADALLSALTVKLFYDGLGEVITGRDGSILVPKKV